MTGHGGDKYIITEGGKVLELKGDTGALGPTNKQAQDQCTKIREYMIAEHGYKDIVDLSVAVIAALEGHPRVLSPIPMHIHCPNCGARHVDEGEWATRPHRTHRCDACLHTWRPSDIPTVGLARCGEQLAKTDGTKTRCTGFIDHAGPHTDA